VRAQQAVTQSVEGAYPHATRVNGQHGRQSCQHFLRGLVGEGHRKHARGRNLPGLNQPGNAGSEHPGLAGSGTGKDQRGLRGKRDGSELFGIEIVQEVLHRRIIRLRCSAAEVGANPDGEVRVLTSPRCTPGNPRIRPAGRRETDSSDLWFFRAMRYLRTDANDINGLHFRKRGGAGQLSGNFRDGEIDHRLIGIFGKLEFAEGLK